MLLPCPRQSSSFRHSQIHSLMGSFGSMYKNFNVPSPKEPAPKARHPMVNQDASPHANRLARPSRFPKLFEEDERALEGNRCQSPTLVTPLKTPRSTLSA